MKIEIKWLKKPDDEKAALWFAVLSIFYWAILGITNAIPGEWWFLWIFTTPYITWFLAKTNLHPSKHL